jgi:hypothetical protein
MWRVLAALLSSSSADIATVPTMPTGSYILGMLAPTAKFMFYAFALLLFVILLTLVAASERARANAAERAQPAPLQFLSRACLACGDLSADQLCDIGCPSCADCTLRWYRSETQPSCLGCGERPSRAIVDAVISHAARIGATTGPLRVVGAEETARWHGTPRTARQQARLSPRSAQRVARDFRALRRDAANLGIAPCPRCGESVSHFREDGCHAVTCGACGATFCWLCRADGPYMCECDANCDYRCTACAPSPDDLDDS